ncbi:YrdB family protein [Streptomyces actuosus]|uniref:YrdB family protein n=1 Tax=Streptomyces actuosus TaxID=1885 RepID=A0ABS2VNW0_STRAS|nr:YrdB family protein [Streptomyces actuosus]MBN0044782.1 YrdB family protein [Streptomyces actuosus]
MKAVRAVNLGVLFLVELGAVAAAAYWGVTLDVPAGLAWLLGLAAPAALIVLWGLFGSPKAPYRTRGAARTGFEVLWFGAGAVALAAAGAVGWAVAFALVCLATKTLAAAWRQ